MFPINREITFRQALYLFIFVSLAQVLRGLPSALVNEVGNAGYMSILIAVFPLLVLAGIIILLLKTYPEQNFFEILEKILGRFLAKVLVLLYIIWALTSAVLIMNQYTLTLQSTLMPYTKSNYFIIVMIILVFYAVHKGMKTIFRISELTLLPILLFLIIMILFGIPKFDPSNLVPIYVEEPESALFAAKYVYTIGGNLILLLFFADKYKDFKKYQDKSRTKLFLSVGLYSLIALVITVSTIAINGAQLTSKLPYSFFMTIKRISIFKVFERFETFITLITALSDFVAISIFVVIIIRCMKWLFNMEHVAYLELPIAAVVYYLTYYLSDTQFELDYFYNNIYIPMNIIYQYLLPIFIILIFFIRRSINKSIP